VTPRPSPLVELDGVPGVLAVLKAGDVPPDELTAALDRAPGPCVVLMDDAELLRDCSAADVLRRVMRSGPDRPQGLVLAGNADDICTGFSGWQVDAKKSRRGALLSPQGTTDGDLIGVRLPRSAVGGAVHPGRALVHLGDSHLQTLAVPLIAAADFRAWTVSPAGLWPAARPPAGRSARPGRGSAPSRRDPGWSGGRPR
jgi:S-DNA-T family DNA segregation ATPase FtsK/SpoIIIE